MSKILKLFFITIFISLLTGCVNKQVEKQDSEVNAKKETKQTTVTKTEEKETVKTKKIKNIYKYCSKHRKDMLFAKEYILSEFNKAYFDKNDIVGAKAQLFLVQSKSPTIFAKNINAALKVYDENYDKAQTNKCRLRAFKTHPLTQIKNKIQVGEK